MAIGFIGCNNVGDSITIQANRNITVVDSSAQTENLWKYDPTERYGYYPIYYIGKPTDTICLGQEKISGYSYGQKDYSKAKNYTLADSTKLKIYVDTSFSLAHTVYYSHYAEKEDKRIVDSTKSFKTFIVFVHNQCDSLISVGIFSELGHTVRQVKDEQGNWKDIEAPIRYFCGTGARDIIIEPGQMLVAKLLRYNGDYKAECRLKYSRGKSTVYSNTFTDYIDKRQLTDTLLTEY